MGFGPSHLRSNGTGCERAPRVEVGAEAGVIDSGVIDSRTPDLAR